MEPPPRRPPGSGPNRRTALRWGLGLGAALAGPFALDACRITRSPGAIAGVSSPGKLVLASPSHPVLRPISDTNPPIADGRPPEKDATLRLYNFADYLDPGAIKTFEAKYPGVRVSVSTFNDVDEAVTKIRSGAVPYDIFFAGYDLMSRLVAAELIRPLNHSYIPTITNLWDSFSDPWYDRKWRYSVPYTVYTTGIGYRVDKVATDIASLPNPWDTLWDRAYRGSTAILDDFRAAIAMCLLRKGITDVNTGAAADLDVAAAELADLARTSAPKITITMYNDLPTGQFGQCQMWSGDVVNAVSYLPKKTKPDVLRYWYPADGKGMIDNDLMLVLRGGKNPVLAHLFVAHMLEEKVAMKNFAFIGYQPPQKSIDPDALVGEGLIPPNLASCVVKEADFAVGYRLLELSAAADAAWHRVWLTAKAGS